MKKLLLSGVILALVSSSVIAGGESIGSGNAAGQRAARLRAEIRQLEQQVDNAIKKIGELKVAHVKAAAEASNYALSSRKRRFADDLKARRAGRPAAGQQSGDQY